MAGVSERQTARAGIRHSVDQGYESSGGKILHKQVVEPGQDFAGGAVGLRERTQHATGGGHEQRGGGALSGDVGEYETPAAVGKRNEVVPVSADGAGGDAEAGNGKAGDKGR